MNRPFIRKSYVVKASHGEVYTGGPIAFHPQFQSLITAQNSRVNAVPIAPSNTFVFPIAGDDSRVMAVAVHKLSGNVAVAHQSGLIRVYEPNLVGSPANPSLPDADVAQSASKRFPIRYKWLETAKWKCNTVTSLAWNHQPHSTRPLVAAASADGTLKVFDQKGCYCTHNFRGHSAPVTLCKFDETDADSPSWLLFSSGHDCTVRVWSLIQSKQIALLTNHMAVVTDIQLVNDCPTGKKLVTVGRDQIVSIYNVDNQKFTLYTTIPVYESIEACIVLGERALYPRTSAPKPPGSLDVLVAGESGRLKIWNSKTSTCVWEQKDPSVPVDYLILAKKTQAEPTQKSDRDFSSSNPEQSQLPPDRQDALVVVTQDRNMHVYSADTLKLTTTIVGYNDEIMDLAHISQDEIAVAINSTCLHLFKLPSFNSRVLGMTDSKENTSNICHKEPILALAVSPCQQWIATAGKDQILIVWCIALNQAVAQLTGHTGAVLATQFCGKTPHYLASGSQDTTVKVWDLSAILKDTPNPTPPPTSQRISASLATVKAHAKDVNCLTISPNNALLATGSQDKTIKLYSLNKLHQRLLVDRGTLQGHKRGVWDLAFSPVDKVLASCSADQTVKLWNIRDLTCIKTFQGHTASVLHVRFITHGLQLLSAGADSLVKLWNIHDNECVNTFDVHEDKIWGLSVEPGSQGASFVTGGSDSLMCLWQDNTEQEIEEEARRRDQDILSTQHLENLTLSEKYTEAVKLSLHLDRPFQTLQALQSMQADPSEEKVRNSLKTLIADLTYEQLQKLLKYVKDWNTNSKYALVSHRILYYIFTTFSPDSLIQLPYMKETLQALIPYTIRHSQRVNRLLQNSYILDYMLQHMSLLPDLDNIDASTEGYRTQLTNAAPAGTEASAGETS